MTVPVASNAHPAVVPVPPFATATVWQALLVLFKTSNRKIYGEPYANVVALRLVMLFVAGSNVTIPYCRRLFSLLTRTGTPEDVLAENVLSPAYRAVTL